MEPSLTLGGRGSETHRAALNPESWDNTTTPRHYRPAQTATNQRDSLDTVSIVSPTIGDKAMQFNMESGEAISNAIDTIDNALATTEDAQRVVINLLGAAPTWEAYWPYAEFYTATYCERRGVKIDSARKKWDRTMRAVGITIPKPPQSTTKEAVKKQKQREAKRDTPAQRAIDAIKAKEKARIAAESKELIRLRDVCIHAVKLAFEAKDRTRLKAMAKTLGKPAPVKSKKPSNAKPAAPVVALTAVK